MIEIVNPGWLSLLVDRGRSGFADTGVPSSAALDRYAFDAANYLTGNAPDAPILEVMGSGFAFIACSDIGCAVTGAKVAAFVDENPVAPWKSFKVPRGSSLTVKEVKEGFRYYIGFSGIMTAELVMGSRTTNLECRFGGFGGRPLMKGDFLEFRNGMACNAPDRSEVKMPVMEPPHLLRIVGGPEMGYFTRESLGKALSEGGKGNFTVSPRTNRTAIRLEGTPFVFRRGMQKSIVSEGILPGTVQVPGDGLPIITLYERTIGGYARLGVIAGADRDLLAHLKPRDKVRFALVSLEEARKLGRYSLPPGI